MTEAELRTIIAAGEGLETEFKGEERKELNDRDLVDAAVCLANRPPGQDYGYLLIGVEDDKRITGARPRHDDTTSTRPAQIAALIANRTRPSLTCRVEVVKLDEGDVIVVEVPLAREPVGTTDGKYQRRVLNARKEPECLPYHYHEMQAQQATRGTLDYSSLMVPDATWEDLDPLEFDRFRRSIRESRGAGDRALLDLTNEEIAKALGAVEANGTVSAIRVLALLLFGKEDALRELLPAHEIAFQVLRGGRVEVNDIVRWPLFRFIDEVLSRFRARNSETEIMLGFVRISVPDYSEIAFREAVANALIHRDYTRNVATHIQWHDDRIEISNPGGFPEGVRLDNLLVTPPRPRNPRLADAFKRAGVVERTGRGIDTIFTEQLRNGRPAPSYDRSTASDVVLILHGGDTNLGFVKLIAEEEEREENQLRLDDLLILNHLWLERSVSTPEIAALIQKSDSEARIAAERLVEVGLLERRGERKGRTYQFSASTYRRIGDKSAYVRQKGFEPARQEEMVLQYVRAHGKITRSEVANLCGIGGQQATRLLRQLSENGRLRQHGAKRGTWYDLGS